MELSKGTLSEYNFIILVDKSGSMSDLSTNPDKTRWQEAADITKQVADFVAPIDDDGIDVVTFGGQFDPVKDVHRKVTSDKVYEIFSTNQPSGSTPLAEAIQAAVGLFVEGKKKAFVTIVTDGVPNDQAAVATLIKDVSQTLKEDSDLTFLFLQVGDDVNATKFLNDLDDNLTGAKFDIVDKRTADERSGMSFEKLFYLAQND